MPDDDRDILALADDGDILALADRSVRGIDLDATKDLPQLAPGESARFAASLFAPPTPTGIEEAHRKAQDWASPEEKADILGQTYNAIERLQKQGVVFPSEILSRETSPGHEESPRRLPTKQEALRILDIERRGLESHYQEHKGAFDFLTAVQKAAEGATGRDFTGLQESPVVQYGMRRAEEEKPVWARMIGTGLRTGGMIAGMEAMPGPGVVAKAAEHTLLTTGEPKAAAETAALMGLGGLGSRALRAPLGRAGLSGVPREAVAGAVSFPVAGTAVRAATGQRTTGEGLATEAILGGALPLAHLPPRVREVHDAVLRTGGTPEQAVRAAEVAAREPEVPRETPAEVTVRDQQRPEVTDAVQERGAAEVPVGEAPRDRPQVDEGVRQQAPAEQRPEAQPGVPQGGERGPSPQEVAQAVLRTGGTPEQAQRAAEVAGGEEGTTSIKNRLVNEERAQQGLGPLPEAETRSYAEVNAQAERVLEQNPRKGSELAAELGTRARPHTDVEVAILNRHKVDLKKDRAQAAQEVVQAQERGDTTAVDEAQARWARLDDTITEIGLATKASGRETARGLAARRMEMLDDYSLDNIKVRLSVAKGGKPLDAAEKAEAKTLADAVQKAIEGERAVQEKRIKEAVDAAIKEIRSKRPVTSKSPEYGKGNRIVTRDAYEKALADFRTTSLNVGIDPAKIASLVKIGTFHLEAGARSFAKWAREMLESVGESARPHLKAVYVEAKKQLAATERGEAASLLKGKDLTEAVVQRHIGKIAESFVAEGVTEREALVTAVHDFVKDAAPNMTRRDVMEALTGYGKVKKLDDDPVKATLRELKGQTLQVLKLQDMAQGKAPLATGLERQPPGEVQRGLIKQVGQAKKVGGYEKPKDAAAVLKTALESTTTRLKNEIADLDRQIAAKKRDVKTKGVGPTNEEIRALKEQRAIRQEQLDAAAPKPGLTEKQRIERLLNRFNQQTAKYEKMQTTGRPPKVERQEPPPTREEIAARARLETAQRLVSEAEFRKKLESENLGQKAWRTALEGSAIGRAIMTGLDVSAVLRQNFFATLSHPVIAAKNLGPMFKAFATPEGQARSEAELRMRPTYARNKKAGLFQSEHGPTADISKMEEAYMTRFLDPSPMVEGQPIRNVLRKGKNVLAFPFAGSGRAFQTFSNRMRMDVMDAMVAGLSKNGAAPTKAELKAIAHAANVFTGRGGPSSDSDALAGLNHVLFSPRLLASRFQTIGGLAQTIGEAATGFKVGGRGSIRGRKAVAKEYARFLGGVAVLYGLVQAAGGKVEDDPKSSDFMKLRLGNTRLDPWAGFQQIVTLEERLRQKETRDLKGKKHDTDVMDTLARFLRTKLAPIPGAAISAVSGKTPTGEETNALKEALGLVTPMSFGDIYDAMREQGVPKGSALSALSLFGMSLSTYKDRAKTRKGEPQFQGEGRIGR